jgi:hypothetical protein
MRNLEFTYLLRAKNICLILYFNWKSHYINLRLFIYILYMENIITQQMATILKCKIPMLESVMYHFFLIYEYSHEVFKFICTYSSNVINILALKNLVLNELFIYILF